jgi:hypothetical protein
MNVPHVAWVLASRKGGVIVDYSSVFAGSAEAASEDARQLVARALKDIEPRLALVAIVERGRLDEAVPRTLAQKLVGALGLRRGRPSSNARGGIVELRTDGASAATPIERLVASLHLGAVMYVGDDGADPDAFAMLARVRRESGIATIAASVRRAPRGRPACDDADIRLDGAVGAAAALWGLAGDLRRPPR